MIVNVSDTITVRRPIAALHDDKVCDKKFNLFTDEGTVAITEEQLYVDQHFESTWSR